MSSLRDEDNSRAGVDALISESFTGTHNSIGVAAVGILHGISRIKDNFFNGLDCTNAYYKKEKPALGMSQTLNCRFHAEGCSTSIVD